VATMGRAARTVVATMVLVAMGVATAACGDDPGDRLPPPASPEPTPSPTATVDPDEAAVREVIDAYLRLAAAAKVKSDPSLDGLDELTTPSFLNVIRGSFSSDSYFNRRYEGTIEVVWVEVVERHTDQLGPQLVVDACLDWGNFVPVDIDTGELNGDDPREHPSRHLARHWLRTNDAGDWVVDNANIPNWFFGEREEGAKLC